MYKFRFWFLPIILILVISILVACQSTGSSSVSTEEPTAISGSVVSAATSDPIPEAYVAIIDSNRKIEGWEETALIQTNNQGEYRFSNIPTGDYYVIAYADGYAREIFDQAFVIQDAQVIHYEGEPITEVDFTLNESGTISGRVTAADGITPIPGITVTVSPDKYVWVEVMWFTATSDADGYYQVNNLPLGDYTVFVEEVGYQNEYFDDVNYLSLFTPVTVQPPADTGGIDILLDLEGRISGRVIDEQTGEPIENVDIHIQPMGPGTAPTWGLVAKSDANGEFMVGMLPPASFLISARADGYGDEIYNHRQGWLQADLVSVPYGGEVTDIIIKMRRGGIIQGHLYDEAGEPLSDFYLDIRTPEDDHASAMPTYATGVDGSFSVCMPPGTYIILADFVPGYVKEYYNDAYKIIDAAQIQIIEGSEIGEIDFFLQLAGTISGTVYHSDGVTPVSEAQVFAFPISGEYGDGAVTDTSGQYYIEGLPSGAYIIQVKVPGSDKIVYYPGVSNEINAKQVEVSVPADTKDIIIILP